MIPRTSAAALLAVVLSTGACASSRDELARQNEAHRLESTRAAERHRAEIAALRERIGALQGRVEAQEAELGSAHATDASLREQLDALGLQADSLLNRSGELSTELARARARLRALELAQAEAEARAAIYRDVALRLKSMIDAGDLRISLRNGRMVLQLPNDVLFDSGRTAIKPRGRAALTEVAAVLKTLPDRRFAVAGHTDDVPIATPRFPSNWELSTARGVEVVRFLLGQGVPPTNLEAAGFGEYDPVAPNADADGRALNRRIEITLEPRVDAIVDVPAEAP